MNMKEGFELYWQSNNYLYRDQSEPFKEKYKSLAYESYIAGFTDHRLISEKKNGL